MFELSFVEVVLLAATTLGTIWALGPMLFYYLGFTRVWHVVQADPGRTEPAADDPDYAERYRQFVELGFRPAGTALEKCWFMNSFTWFWQSGEICWLGDKDGSTFVSFHRLAGDPTLRFGAISVTSNDGMIRTTCPGAGLQTKEGNWLRVEVQNVEPAELLQRHREHVDLFCRERGLQVERVSLQKAIEADQAYDLWALRRSGGQYQVPLSFFAFPVALAVGAASALDFAADWRTLAGGLCVGAAVFAVFRYVMLPVLFQLACACGTPTAAERTPDGDVIPRA